MRHFASDATYYLIDGKPTKHTGAYAGTKASVVDGFDGNPDVKAAEASDVRKSDIRNDGDSANDIYNVADVASKIDDNGAGDIVAVYMYDDDMGEKISINGATVTLTNANITVGQDAEVSVTLPKDENLDTSKVYVQVVDKDGKVVVSKTNVTDVTKKLVLNTKDLKEGTYTVQLFGYNKTDKNDDLLASATLNVGAKQMYTVSAIEWVTDSTGATTSTTPVIEAGTDGVFYVKVTSTPADAVLAKENLEVRVRGSVKDFELVSVGNGVYKITIANGEKINVGDKVNVTMKKGAALTEVPTTPIEGDASVSTSTSPDVAKVGTVDVKVDSANKATLLVQVLEGTSTRAARAARVERAAGAPIVSLKATDFVVTVNDAPVQDIQAVYDMSKGCYALTASTVSDWTAPAIKNVKVAVGAASDTVAKMDTTVKIEIDGQNNNFTIGTQIPEGGFEFGTLKLTNLFDSEVQVKEVKKNDVKDDNSNVTFKDGKVYLNAKLFEGLTNTQTVKFILTDGTNDSTEFVVTAKNAPALTDALNAVQTAGAEKVTGQAAVYTGKFTAAAASETINLTVKSGGTEIVKLASHQTVKSTPSELAKEVADKLNEELAKKPEMQSKYVITNTGDKVTVTASGKTEGETLDIEFSGGSTTKFAKEAGECKNGVADKAAVAGTLEFTIPAGVAENGNYKLVIDTAKSKNVTIAVTKEMTTEQIAELVVTEVKKINELDASNTGAQVTITEKTGSEKQVFVDTTADDVVFTKQG